MSRGTRYKRTKRKACREWKRSLGCVGVLNLVRQLPEANPPAFEFTVLPEDFRNAVGFEVPRDMVLGIDGVPWVMADRVPARGEWALDNFGNAWVPRTES